MVTAIAIGIVAAVILIRTAATTEAVLPVADSATAVQEHYHRCRIGGPIGGVVIDSDAVAADAPEASGRRRLTTKMTKMSSDDKHKEDVMTWLMSKTLCKGEPSSLSSTACLKR